MIQEEIELLQELLKQADLHPINADYPEAVSLRKKIFKATKELITSIYMCDNIVSQCYIDIGHDNTNYKDEWLYHYCYKCLNNRFPNKSGGVLKKVTNVSIEYTCHQCLTGEPDNYSIDKKAVIVEGE